MNKALIDRLDNIPEAREAPELSQTQRRELRDRLAHHQAHPDEPTATLAEIRKSLGVDRRS